MPERQPYAGELVFTAFSGSHQDAIKKGLDRRAREVAKNPDIPWGVPYLTIDPQDIGRSYEAIIRINSQSGKGGVAYVLDREHGFDLPKTMHPQVGKRIYDLADELGRELSLDEIREAFLREFVNISNPLDVTEYELVHHVGERGQVQCTTTIVLDGESLQSVGIGNGPIAGVSSLGTRPTVNGREPLLEAHLFDFDGDLYGKHLRVEFVCKLRDEEKFDDLAALVQQMDRDAAQAREVLACRTLGECA